MDAATSHVITPFHAILARDIILVAEHGSIAPAEPVPTAQKDVPIIAKTTIFRTLVLIPPTATAFTATVTVLVLVTRRQAPEAEAREEARGEARGEAPAGVLPREDMVSGTETMYVGPVQADIVLFKALTYTAVQPEHLSAQG